MCFCILEDPGAASRRYFGRRGTFGRKLQRQDRERANDGFSVESAMPRQKVRFLSNRLLVTFHNFYSLFLPEVLVAPTASRRSVF